MFALALTQTAQLIEQAKLLCKTIESHDSCDDQTRRRIDEAIIAILATRDEMESLCMTLKRAISLPLD